LLFTLEYYISKDNYIGLWKAWFRHPNLLKEPSIRIPRTEAQSWPSLGPTSVSLLVIQGNPRVTAYKHDTRLKSSDCMSAFLLVHLNCLIFVVGQNRQGCSGCKWFRCRREHVCEESAATFRGVYTRYDLDSSISYMINY
jgi:hypothetical protein